MVTILVDAAPDEHTAVFYIGLNKTKAHLDLDFSDGTVSPASEDEENAGGALAFRYEVKFKSPNAGAKLRMRWTMLTVPDPSNSTLRLCGVAYD